MSSHNVTTSPTLYLLQSVSQHALAVSLLAASLSLLGYIIYQRLLSPLAKIPGPFWASLSPLWKLRSFARGDFHETIVALHQKYGPVVRIAPTEVILSDKTAIREVYSTVHGRDYLKVSFIPFCASLSKASCANTRHLDGLL